MTDQGTTRQFTVAGIGEVLWDLLPGGKQLGGAPANVVCHAHALGARAILVSRVGGDCLGAEIRARLQELGIDPKHLGTDPERPTGTVEVTLDGRGHPEYVIREEVAWDTIPFTRPLRAVAAACDAVCFGSLCSREEPSRTSIRRFLDSTRAECLRVFDVNLRQHYYSAGLIRDLLGRASVVKLNDAELPVVCDCMGITVASDSDEARCRALISACGLKLLALTCGGSGSMLITADGVSEHPGVRVRPVDTVGAGDSFTAALVMGLLRGDSLDVVNDQANRVAAFVCTCNGATPPLPEGLV